MFNMDFDKVCSCPKTKSWIYLDSMGINVEVFQDGCYTFRYNIPGTLFDILSEKFGSIEDKSHFRKTLESFENYCKKVTGD